MNVASKSLQRDQHFMVDKSIIRKIILFANIKPNENVVEIGAGKGILTKELAKISGKVTAIEIDKKLKPVLEKELRGFNNATILIKNALKVDLSSDKIVGNIPYAICESLIQRLPRYRFKKAVFTVSKSFAYRLLAKPGDENYSNLSVFSQKNFEIKIELYVPKDAFKPKPKTNSVVISVIKK